MIMRYQDDEAILHGIFLLFTVGIIDGKQLSGLDERQMTELFYRTALGAPAQFQVSLAPLVTACAVALHKPRTWWQRLLDRFTIPRAWTAPK